MAFRGKPHEQGDRKRINHRANQATEERPAESGKSPTAGHQDLTSDEENDAQSHADLIGFEVHRRPLMKGRALLLLPRISYGWPT